LTKTLVFGSNGLLGGAFCRKLGSSFPHTPVGREVVDLKQLEKLQDYLEEADFDLLINASGMCVLENCEDFPDEAELVNAQAPKVMADVCATKGAKMVHFSTDYVFDGNTPGKLSEEDRPSPLSKYGNTKLKGEEYVLEHIGYLVCRVSWLFGGEGNSVFDEVLEKISSGEEMRYVADKWSIPTYADDVVDITLKLLEKKAEGLFHLCSDSPPVSWWEYAMGVARCAKESGNIKELPLISQGRLETVEQFRVPRPRHTAMSVAKLKALDIEMPDWRDAASRYIETKEQS